MKKLNPSAVTIVFVPFFGGKIASLKRHLQFVEGLGFKTQFVELEFATLKLLAKPFSASSQTFGMKAIWADQIEKALNAIQGPKVIFAFSNPTAAAIEAISRRGAHDILGLVADSGPTGEIWNSMVKYFTFEKPLRPLPLRWLAATASAYMLSPKQKDFCSRDLAEIPSGFKILSIRGWKDPLISPQQIDLIFEPHHHLEWQKLALPKAEHLNGLRDYREEYEKPVIKFLELITSSLPLKDLQGSAPESNQKI